LNTEACLSFNYGWNTDSSDICAWYSNIVDVAVLIPVANFSVYNKKMDKVRSVVLVG
jgi:hypothetical protein